MPPQPGPHGSGADRAGDVSPVTEQEYLLPQSGKVKTISADFSLLIIDQITSR